jgi:hypothetical protein
VRVTDPDAGEGVSLIELFRGVTGGPSDAARVAWNSGSDAFAWRERETFPAGTEAHYYLRIRMDDNQSLWTGPVYVTSSAATTVALGEGPSSLPALRLVPRPNPSRGRVTITFALEARATRARLDIFDPAGRLVRTLLDGAQPAGEASRVWDGRALDGDRLPPGVYLMRLEADDLATTRKIHLVR